MNQRERILAGGVGFLALCLVLYFGGGFVLSMFSSRTEEIDRLTAQRDQLNRDVNFGTHARGELAGYERRSLPGDLEVAKTRYKNWLFALADKEGLLETQISPAQDASVKGIGNTVGYNVTTFGRLPQLVAFLHEIYRVELLHRVESLRIQPVANDPRYLRIQIGLEALWIDTNEGTEIPTASGERLAFESPERYQRAISDRNLFGLPNKPVSLDAPSSTRVYLGERVNVEVKATDADPRDALTFALGKGAPEDVQIVPADPRRDIEGGSVTRSARIGWTPTKLGTFQIPISVADDGLPSSSVAKTIEVTVSEKPAQVVAEPPPPKPDFDVAKFTKFTSQLAVDGVPEMWLYEQTGGKMHVLRVGDEFEIGSVTGTVEEISERNAVFRTDDGRLRIQLGQFLTEAEELIATEEPEAF